MVASSLAEVCNTRGVFVLPKFQVNSQKLEVQAPQNLEFE